MSAISDALSFSPEYRVEVVPGEGAYLLSERSVRLLAGAENVRLASLIDGTRSADDIARQMDGVLSAAEVYYRLRQMIDKGYVEVSRHDMKDLGERAFWRNFGLAVGIPEKAGVDLVAFGETDLAPFSDALALCRIETGGEFLVAVTDDYLRPELAALNEDRLANEQEWLLVKPTGAVPWVGPIFAPSRTGCWQCLASRLERNQEVGAYLSRRATSSGRVPTIVGHPAAVLLTAQLAAMEVTRWLAGNRSQSLEGSLISFDLSATQTTRHALVRRPQCSACGQGGGGEPTAAMPRLTNRPKIDMFDGLQRTITADETLRRYRHHVSPLIGAVTQLTPVSLGSDELLNVYIAGHNFAVRSPDLGALRQGLRTSSAGKGMTRSQAEASALCEGLERYSGIFDGSEPRISATYEELGDDAIHPNACMLFSELQFAERERLNARKSTFQVVPHPFREDERHEWSPVWSLTRERMCYLPTGYLYYDYPVCDSRFQYWADSNGCAAGNCAEEAILSGIFELVERDAVAIWWYNRLRQPAVDIGSFDDPWLAAVERRCRNLRREIWALDLTADTGIPVFGAFSRRVDKPVEDILLAFGAHLDPRIALRRAIAEVTQFLPAVVHVDRDGSGYAFDDPESLAWWRGATVENQPYLLPDPAATARTPASYNRLHSTDVLDDITLCQDKLEERGLELILHDQTRSDIGLPVWKAVVPGMRHFWARLGGGRLYDVPVGMGRLAKPTQEAELNPIAMFI